MIQAGERRGLMGQEEAIAEAIVKIIGFSDEELHKVITDLKDWEVNLMTVLQTIGEEMGLDSLKALVRNFCLFRISMGRLGRKEMIHLITFAGLGEEYFGGGRKRVTIKQLIPGLK